MRATGAASSAGGVWLSSKTETGRTERSIWPTSNYAAGLKVIVEGFSRKRQPSHPKDNVRLWY
jgi:hypothetical protein